MGSGAIGLYAFVFCCSKLVVLATNLGRPICCSEEVEEFGVDTRGAVSSVNLSIDGGGAYLGLLVLRRHLQL